MKIIDKALLDRTSEQARKENRLRKNYNLHERLCDPVNRLLNALESGTYIPAHRHSHPAKDETVIVLRGSVVSVIFDDAGNIVERVEVSPALGVYGFDIPAGQWHGLLVRESGTVVFEVKKGPFTPLSEEDITPWTPRTDDKAGIARYLNRLSEE